MFRCKVLNICSNSKRIAALSMGRFALVLVVAACLGLSGSTGCESMAGNDRDPLADCLTHREALCQRYGECLGKPASWQATCLAQQDEVGGACEALIQSKPCYKSRSVLLATCAEELPGKSCLEVCVSGGGRTVCSSPCPLVCSTTNPGLDN